MEKATITVGSMNEETGVVVFNIRIDNQRHAHGQEVTCTGDLRADVAKAARWFLGGHYGMTGKLRRRQQGYCELPHAGLAAYGITRETAAVGQVSVDAPVFDVLFG